MPPNNRTCRNSAILVCFHFWNVYLYLNTCGHEKGMSRCVCLNKLHHCGWWGPSVSVKEKFTLEFPHFQLNVLPSFSTVGFWWKVFRIKISNKALHIQGSTDLSPCGSMGLGPWPLGRSIRGESGGRPSILLSRPEKQSSWSCEHWKVCVPSSCLIHCYSQQPELPHLKRKSSNRHMEASVTRLSQMYLDY